MIDIKDTSNNNRLSTQVNEGSIYKYTLLKEEYILLKFSVENPIYFRLGDYTDIYEGLFEIVDLVFPTYNKSTGGYDYDLRMDAHYWKWKHKKLFYDRQKGKEAKWSLTRTPDAHMSIVVSNIAALGYTYKGKPYVFSMDATVKMEPIFIQYDNTNIIDGISMIAEACGCEWWVKENYIFLGHCEDTIKDVITLEMGNELSDMTRSDSTSTYATRIISFGSERNIPKNYRPDSDDLVIEGVVQRRLKLPEGIPYVDAYPDMTTEEAIENVVLFDNVYPRRIGTISEVNETRGNIVDENGKPTGETYPIFTIRDAGLKNFKKEYLLDELRFVFQSGSMNGMHFALELKSSDDTGTVFEIERNQNYGQFLPNDIMKPEKDGTYILYGYDTSFISDTLIGEAEQELLEETQKYVEKSKIDPSVYVCPTNPVRCAGYIDGKHNQQKEIDLEIGRRVKLINNAFFKDGRESRIYGFEKKLDNPFECTYTVGESTQYSRIGDIENRLDELKYSGNTYVNTGGGSGGIYVIKTNDSTIPTDQNVYSALMTDAKIYKAIEDNLQDLDGMFLRKDIPDTAHGAISFEDMAQSTLFAEGYEWGAGWGINNEGLGWFGELKVRDNVYIGKMSGSPSSASGMMGYGTILDMQKASGEFDYLLARKEFRVNTMVVNETLGLNGNRFVSDFNKIESVQELSDRYRCKIDKIEGMMYMNIRGDDLICCQQFSGLSSHYYYGEVLGITEDYFDLRKPLLDGHSVPMAGDTVFRAGNDSDPNRQGVIYLATSDTNAPYIDVLDGLTSPDMTDKTKVRIGNVSGITSKYKGNLGQLGYHHGIYIKGGIFEECDIYLEDGTTVYQSFQIINGKLESEISSIRDAINDNGNNILSNPTWTAGLDKWDYTQDINLFSATNGWLWFNAAFYSDKKSSVEVIRDSASRVLRMYKSGITQVNANLQGRESGTYVMRIRYKAITAGTLTYGFSGKELYKSTLVTATTDYQEETITAEWDGTGDFSCTYSGDIYIKSLTVISDRIAAIRNEFETKIEQTDQKIELLATRVTTTEEGVTQAQASISVMADEIALKATKDEFNALGRRVTANEASITVNADAIKLKVSQIDFDSLGRRITSAESSIETNAYQISLKASQYSVSSLTGRVLSAESAIQVNADNISSKVAVTDYTGTNIVSMINQTADAVKIMASKVDIQAYNLNMIRNSGECQNTVYWQVDGGASNLSVSNGSISVNFSNISGWLYNRSLAGIQLLVRRKYTLRISLYSSVSTTVTVWIGPYQTDIPVSVGDREYTYTFTVSSNTDAQFFCMACSTSCRMMVHRVKFEDGEYATPWTPNPNDSIYSLDSDLVAALNGTTISGGLQLTTKIKLGLLSGGVWTEQGGISANIDNIMLWAGGTYDQAKAGNVKTILRHDGSLKAEGEFECGSKTGNRCLLSGDGRFRMFRGEVEILNLGYFVESDTYYYPSLSMTRKTSSGTAFGGVTLSPTELLFSSPDGLGCLYGNNNMIFNINKFPTSGSMVGAVYRDGNTLKIRTS